MAQVKVTINGKAYRMACDDGQEEHLAALAGRLDSSVQQLRARFGEIGDQRLTVMAAITLADAQADAERKLAAAHAEIAALEEAHADMVQRLTTADTGIAGSIAAIADRLEEIASRIEAVDTDRGG